ncbi:allantoin permease [Polyplosphaeria fusca]|uniref:Allantoin permease n=1 Tax=Polyplosphaeria fusca TaxID=682080 RepID=A0A9P4QW63_9PLEO|nr:allantoin permease [Polyplosphaeria fusca]
MNRIRAHAQRAKRNVASKKSPDGWILEKQPMTFADENSWSNRDSDVTPLERRTWSAWSILGFWFSDALNIQGWASASAIIAVGLTWRESVYCLIIGSLTVTIPLCMNGAMGAELHVPFPVGARSSFGFYFSRFAVIIRMITALFWHAIQTYTGSTAVTQMIRAIWPSYLNIPNHLPESAGITTQGMVSHFLFWSIQFPILLIPPHKLRWFFVFKTVVVLTACTGTVIGMSQLANGVGDIWDQQATVSGPEKSWLILASMSAMTGSWATMATNVADFTRYLEKPKGVYGQTLFMPAICTLVGVFGIIGTSCSKTVYGEYIWDPLALASQWDGPKGRAAAFFVGFAWAVAQIGTNLSANVISCSNDMVNLWPKYINIQRGVIITTVTGGWIMVPWKIVHSAESLLNFMSALGVFLAPLAAIMACDFWVVRRRAVDVPALYRRQGRYRYNKIGTNWRAAVALIIGVTPNIPGMAAAVNTNINIHGAAYIYDIFYLYGFGSAFFMYSMLSWIFPATETLVRESIHEDVIVVDGVEKINDGVHQPYAYEKNVTTAVEEKESRY